MRGRLVFALVLAAFVWIAGASAGERSWAGRYTVRPGDSLTAIAHRFGVSVQALADANGLDWRSVLLSGAILHVPSAGATSTSWGGFYLVRPGDTLGGIALRYGVSLSELASANRLTPGKILLAGASLHVPSAAATSTGSTRWIATYVVRAGDTLGGIALRYGVSLSELASANRLNPGKVLEAGVSLHVPSGAATSTRSTDWSASYVVRAGDTLGGIALHFGVSLSELASANRLSPGGVLLAGASLRVPTTASGPGGWSGVYVVQPGDTLSGIALRYGVPLSQLASTNGVDPSGLLLVGARLSVPDSSLATVNLSQVEETNPYQQGSTGFDLSFPGCATGVLGGLSFAVVGLNAGRPFTSNPCFESEWIDTQPPQSVYINTAYSSLLFGNITSDCSAAGANQRLDGAGQQAYALGCSEAEAALQLLAGKTPRAIWLDVEPSNTWSAQRSLNVATIEGILERLLVGAPYAAIGVYSNPNFWRAIVGDWSSLSVPEWVSPYGQVPPSCPAGFASGPVWLSQAIDGLSDIDTAC